MRGGCPLMAIDLPPPQLPQEAQLSSFPAGAATAAFTVTLGNTRLHVFGPPPPEALLRLLLARAQTQSDVVYAVRDAYYSSGYPVAKIAYALNGDDLYVSVAPQPVTAIQMPQRYQPYFEDLPSREALDVDALESARILASEHADRAGESLQMALRPEAGGVAVLLAENGEGPAQTSLAGGFGNPGNRVLGRYFADLLLKQNFGSGDTVAVGGRYAFPELDDGSADAEYADASVAWSHVGRLGLFGLTASYIDYSQKPELDDSTIDYEFKGNIRQAEASWQNLLSASLSHRWTLGGKVDYVWKRLKLDPLDLAVQRQTYTSVEVSTGYRCSVLLFERAWDFDLSLALRKGLGDDRSDDPEVFADLGYLLLRPDLRAQVPVADRQTVQLRVSGQWSGDTLPEQQQWVLGGRSAIESYLPGFAYGDQGALAALQWELTLAEWAGWKLAPKLFAEYGVSRVSEAGFILDGNGRSQSVADAGAALTVDWRKHLSLSVSAAAPLASSGINRQTRDDTRADLLFRVELRL